jgi:formylglycine-generating enzyme required for sulfatase activity
MKKETNDATATRGGAGVIACVLLLAGASGAPAGDDAEARFRGTGKADPVRIANVRRSDGPATGQSSVTFDLAWDHSWRAAWEVPEEQHGGKGTLKLESWDAAWVFVKFRKPGADGYSHATLSTNKADHKVPGGAALDVGLTDDGKRGLGAFVYRDAPGHGANDWKGVTLRWLHGADGVADPGAADLKVFAIQMVYVPQCAFWAGDGSTAPAVAQFSAGDTTDPFRIEGEDALTLGGESKRNLGNRDGLGVRLADDFTSVVTQTLPARFPKGYAAFYCMRHEITQGQHVDFLNTLNCEQQSRLDKRGRKGPVAAGTPLNAGCQAGDASKFRNGIKIAVPDIPGTGGKPATPAVYATDTPHVAHGAGHHHQITVTGGPHGGCNGVFYAAWAGLRPMTELEYEKACRGPLKPVPGEYAWGTARIAGSNSEKPSRDGYALRNPGRPDEHVVWEGGNGPDATRGNAAWGGTIMQVSQYRMYALNAINGPLRVGAFATPDSGRVAAGASYWGILDLTGNLWEEVVIVGDLAGPWDEVRKRGRRFAGTHGDGTLAQPAGWEGLGQRGGAMDSHPVSTSHRVGHGYGSSGFRCVRTAP